MTSRFSTCTVQEVVLNNLILINDTTGYEFHFLPYTGNTELLQCPRHLFSEHRQSTSDCEMSFACTRYIHLIPPQRCTSFCPACRLLESPLSVSQLATCMPLHQSLIIMELCVVNDSGSSRWVQKWLPFVDTYNLQAEFTRISVQYSKFKITFFTVYHEVPYKTS